jgi:putative hydrolase
MKKSNSLLKLQEIRRDHIPRFDFHLHTSWTDGKASVTQMHDRAVACGLKFVLFSEHARHTSGDWFGDFVKEVRALPDDKCKAFVGVETKVEDFEGKLDITKDILSQCDLVMASVHRLPKEGGGVKEFKDLKAEEALQVESRLAHAVLENPQVDILGHPFGMTYRRFGTAPPEDLMRSLISKAAKEKKAFEINCFYHPNPWQLIAWCKEAGALMSLGSNAHELESVGRIVNVLEGKEAVWNPCAS